MATRMASSLSTITFTRRKRCVCACGSTCVRVPEFTLSPFHLLPYQYLHSFINEVTILVPVLSSDFKHTFAIYTPERTKQRWPIRLATATELEMHDWVCKEGLYPSSKGKHLQCSSSFFISLPVNLKLALLSVSCCDSRGIQGPPSKQAIWSITCKGDIFVSEPSPALEAVPYPTPCDQM